MRVHLTRNVNKKSDFVNGMEATVRNLHVIAATGKGLALFPLTDELEDGRVARYPARPGHASNIHKLQGAELSHVTIWPARWDYLLGGLLGPEHFAPAGGNRCPTKPMGALEFGGGRETKKVLGQAKRKRPKSVGFRVFTYLSKGSTA